MLECFFTFKKLNKTSTSSKDELSQNFLERRQMKTTNFYKNNRGEAVKESK
jgi:hypothetical protein